MNNYLGPCPQQGFSLRDALESHTKYLRDISSLASALTQVRARLHQQDQVLQRIGQCDDLDEIHRMIHIVALFLQVKQACAPLAQRGDIAVQQGQQMVEVLDAFQSTITAMCHVMRNGVLPNVSLLNDTLYNIEERTAERADDLDAALPDLLVAHKNPHQRRFFSQHLEELEESLMGLHDHLTGERQLE